MRRSLRALLERRSPPRTVAFSRTLNCPLRFLLYSFRVTTDISSSGNQVCLITGASSGIGRALALELARRGFRVAAASRRTELLERLVDEIGVRNGEAIAVEMDVTDPESVERGVAETRDRLGKIDLVVANAGVSVPMTVRKMEGDEARIIARTNFEGLLNLYAATVPRMVEDKEGHFVGISSVSSFRGVPGMAVYSATKAAVRAFLEAARVELTGTGVDVTIINPGFVRTEMTDGARFRMPFIMSAEKASGIIAGAIERRRAELSFPLPMVLMMRLMRLMPIPLFDRLTRPFAAGPSRPRE